MLLLAVAYLGDGRPVAEGIDNVLKLQELGAG